ncbi:hypothetical protein KAURM247S_08246 [Kitasatospora aureofaciens]
MRRPSSSTYTRKPATARPIGGTPEPGDSGSLMVAHTVVSVGPYALIIRRPGAHRSTSSDGHASPATTRVAAVTPALSTAARAEGGRVTWVMPSRPSVRASRGASAVARTRAAPLSRALHRSQKEASKLGEAACSTLLPGTRPSRSICAAARPETPEWLTTTPLGRPVEPEV